MPREPKAQKRPAGATGNAAKVLRIAAGGEQEDFPADDGKDKAAQSLGRLSCGKLASIATTTDLGSACRLASMPGFGR